MRKCFIYFLENQEISNLSNISDQFPPINFTSEINLAHSARRASHVVCNLKNRELDGKRKNCKELEQGKYIDFSYICDDGNFNLIFLLAFLASIAIIQLCVFFSCC